MKKPENSDKKRNKFVGVLFEECNVYSRIYINKEGTVYIGFCPKCGRKIEIEVGKKGDNSKFFKSSIM